MATPKRVTFHFPGSSDSTRGVLAFAEDYVKRADSFLVEVGNLQIPAPTTSSAIVT
jgi:hypothetical protein